MSKIHKRRLLELLTIVVALILLPTIIFGEPRMIKDQFGGDPWRNIIFDFQTLITGVLAVFAAAVTVFTMNKTDENAAYRHRQIVALQLRPDALRVNRFWKGNAALVFNVTHVLRASLFSLETERNNFLEGREQLASNIYDACARLREFLASKERQDAEYLFDGILFQRLRKLARKTDIAVECANQLSKPPNGLFVAGSSFENDWHETTNAVRELLSALGQVQGSFYELTGLYEEVLSHHHIKLSPDR